MAEELQTDVTNSEATQTGAPEATTSTTSTTDPQTDPAESQPNADDTPKDEPTGEVDLLDDQEDGLAGKREDAPEGDPDGEKPEAVEYIGAPEGDYELELPEGMALDEEALSAFAPTAKEVGLSNAGLSKLASEAYPVVEGQVQKAMIGQVVAQRKAWSDATRTAIAGGKDAEGNVVKPDPVFSGSNQDEVMSTAAAAMDRFTNDASGQPIMFPGAKEDGSEGTFRDFLRSTGLSNHPAMVRFAYLAGRSISEDSNFHRSGDVPTAKLTREEKYYGTQK